jgi:hypothetical protein
LIFEKTPPPTDFQKTIKAPRVRFDFAVRFSLRLSPRLRLVARRPTWVLAGTVIQHHAQQIQVASLLAAR